MDIKKGISGLILTATVLGFSVSAGSGCPVYAGNEASPASSYDLSVTDFLPSDIKDGAYTAKITVPAFDQAKLYWDSTSDPEFSMRVCKTSDLESSKSSKDSENWSDWQNFMESGQSYLRNISGLFSLNLFSSEPEELTVEIRSGHFENADLSNIHLELSSEKKDLRSTISMIVVMLAAGGALYIKKRRMVQN